MDKRSSGVLVVEDDDVAADALIRTFKRAGLQPNFTHVVNGIQAIRALEEDEELRNGMVILDLNLPFMDGFEFLEEVRSNPDFKDLAVFVLTTSEYDRDKEQAKNFGVEGYFVKRSDLRDHRRMVELMKPRFPDKVFTQNTKKPTRSPFLLITPSQKTNNPLPDNANKILLVEDDGVFQQHIKRLIGDTCKVFIAPSIKAARRSINSRKFDCVILDYRLPDGDGTELISDLAQKYIPCILLSAQGSDRVASEAFKLGCNDYLIKGEIGRGSLLDSIDAVIEKAKHTMAYERNRESLESFVQTVAHDLKAPLSVIIGQSHMIQDDVKKENFSKLGHEIDYVIKAGNEMHHLLDALLEYSTQCPELKARETDLNQVFNSVKHVLMEDIESNNAVVECHPEKLPTIYADGILLVQLLQNLIANAIKYCTDGTPEVVVAVDSPEDEDLPITIEVRDNGIGIPKKFLQDVFKPLFRTKQKKKEKGFGIGLATCKQIVQLHHGNIWVEDNSRGGSSFYITIPKNLDEF